MLLRMYVRWGERRKFDVEVLEETAGDEAGIKSATIMVKGHNAHGWLKTESGVHRLVRISPFDSNARRHTSFASVWVYPVVDDRIRRDQRERLQDRHLSRFRRGRPARQQDRIGGAHHPHADRHRRRLPAGALAAQEPRHRLEHAAGAALRARTRNQGSQVAADAASKTEIGWGHQIRSYVLQPYQMVKDSAHRLHFGTPAEVLDGDLDPFMEASLAQRLSGRTVPGRGRGVGHRASGLRHACPLFARLWRERTSTSSRPRQFDRWPQGGAAAGGRRRTACRDQARRGADRADIHQQDQGRSGFAPGLVRTRRSPRRAEPSGRVSSPRRRPRQAWRCGRPTSMCATTTHFGWRRHAAANSCCSAPHSGRSSSQ